jgi:flagellin
MSVVLNTNYSATMAANNLAASSSMLQKSLNRLSSGSKIVNPSDDAGGLAVSMKLAATAKRQGAVNSNIGNAVSMLQTQDGAMKVTGNILARISELRTLYDDVTKSTSDKANYNTEFTALKSQLTAITSEKFNGVSMFGTSSGMTVTATEDGSTSSQISIATRDLGSTSTGVGAVTAATSLSSITSIATVTTALENVANMRASNGAEQSRLGFASELLIVNKANLEAATSRIIDVDVAEESTNLARWNTLVSAGTSMLSQANQSAQTALKLLQ